MIIRDEIHGTIEFDDLEQKIIDTPDFQRLRRIKQMSVANLVYPGANHTRFEHSLGTAHLSSLICRRAGLNKETTAKVKLYALLHDVGHTAFSHEGEAILRRHIGDHELNGKKKITKGSIADIINERYSAKEIANIEESHYGSIITSDLGADRMDYLKRDAMNTGVAYGVVDVDRILDTLIFTKEGLVIDKGGLEAAEFLLIARFMMFSAVYMHRTVRIATAMLYRAIEGSLEDGTIEPKHFADLDDEQAMNLMRRSIKGGRFADALLSRQLYKEVCTLSRIGLDNHSAKVLEEKLCKKTGQDIIVDFPHPFFKMISIRVKNGDTLVPISNMSTLVRSLREAEEDRMKVLVLAHANVRDEDGKKIERLAKKL